MFKKLMTILILLFLFAGCATNGKTDGKVYPTLEVGTQAPDFWMKNQKQLRISLSDFIGKKNVILVFFPMAFTPV